MPTYHEERFPIPTPGRLIRELRLRRPPWWLIAALIAVVVATWIPLAMIYHARQTTSRQPRVHFIMDMDRQPKFGPQAAHPWYLDGRAMRLPVEGTVARGRLRHDQHFSLGYRTDDGTPTGKATEFFAALPSQVATVDTKTLLARGKARYDIDCRLCHGTAGGGDGIIHQRGLELKENKWVPPANLLTRTIRGRADGQLYQAISDGVRNMPGFGEQISPFDRWAIVAYVRELQKTQPVAPEPTEQP